jgi:hypothetical protein
MTKQKSIDHLAAEFFSDFFGDSSLQDALQDGREFTYSPKEDITVQELALCVYLLMEKVSSKGSWRSEQVIYDALPAEAQRHFTVVPHDLP